MLCISSQFLSRNSDLICKWFWTNYKFRLEAEKHEIADEKSSQIDNFIPLLTDALSKISNEDIDLFIKYCWAPSDRGNGSYAKFSNKWWHKDLNSTLHSKRANTPEGAKTLWSNYPNWESESWKEWNIDKENLSHKELDTLIHKFEQKIESDKNYHYYMQEFQEDKSLSSF